MPRPNRRLTRADGLYQLMTVVLPEEFGKGRAACADEDPELFFPLPGHHAQIAQAKAVCEDCPLQASCLTFALRRGEKGIWGGTSENERRALRQADRTRHEAA